MEAFHNSSLSFYVRTEILLQHRINVPPPIYIIQSTAFLNPRTEEKPTTIKGDWLKVQGSKKWQLFTQ